jgi:hypothetical protein
MLLWPQFLPDRHQSYLHAAFPSIPSSLICGWVLALILVLLGIRKRHGLRQSWLYGATAVSFMLVILLAEPIMTAVSMQRSSKELAEKAASFIGREDRLVLYRGYPSSLPFYLHIRRPIAVVWSENQRAVLGSDYIALKRPEPAHGYDKVLYTYDEFAHLWQSSPGHLVVFVSRGALEQFERHQGIRPKRLADLGETILLENR